MDPLYFKALHLIFVVTWFAGLFYIVRLFIYFTEAKSKAENEKELLQNQFRIMQSRLWYGITWPSAILTALFGFAQLHQFFPLSNHPWLQVKFILVFLLYAYHLSCGYILKKLHSGSYPLTSTQLRIWNEVATLFLVGIIFLAVMKSVAALGLGMAGLFGLMIVMMIFIKLYRTQRKKKGENVD